ncbi:MAG: hypothetical protein H5T42_00650 [Methanothrix sp.]|uniref:hypothetical protein n=1 Tax=Methanothrix sp. TaxID=90426 RepID=UPI001996EA95|nr:hypothetical protein [Methanothrix sp.]MBC7078982.1 hypothetical protein [Methanothrix sp.]NPU87142.1 hypothetical protein [Methanothrix sp.]
MAPETSSGLQAGVVDVLSVCIRRDGALPEGSPVHTGARMRLRGLAFHAWEHARGHGEEVVVVAGKRYLISKGKKDNI